MGKQQILKNLMKGSGNMSQSYRRFLLESVKSKGWNAVVHDLAVWLHYNHIEDVEEALLDYLSNEPMPCVKETILGE